MFICFVGVKFRILITVFLLLSMAACHDTTDESVSKVIQVLPVLPDTRSSGVPPASAVNEASAVVSASGVVVNPGEMRALPVDFLKPKFEASDPAAPLEVAVLCQLGAEKMFILPIMSIPMHPEQFPNGRNNREGSMSMIMISQLIALPDLGESDEPMTAEKEEQELLKREELFVAQENYMSSIPKSWVDYASNRYTPKGAAARDDGVVGGALGFELMSVGTTQENGYKLHGQILLNRADGFPPERVVSPNEWKQWPEFLQELKYWTGIELGNCENLEVCKKAVEWLALPKHINGMAREFSLVDGRKLQFVQASSKTNGKGVLGNTPEYVGENTEPDEMQANLWRIVNMDGSAKLLRTRENISGNIDDSVLVDHYCGSQCSYKWSGSPSVISAKGRTFIIGGFSGGTLYGYLILEVLPTELVYIGKFAWGS